MICFSKEKWSWCLLLLTLHWIIYISGPDTRHCSDHWFQHREVQNLQVSLILSLIFIYFFIFYCFDTWLDGIFFPFPFLQSFLHGVWHVWSGQIQEPVGTLLQVSEIMLLKLFFNIVWKKSICLRLLSSGKARRSYLLSTVLTNWGWLWPKKNWTLC